MTHNSPWIKGKAISCFTNLKCTFTIECTCVNCGDIFSIEFDFKKKKSINKVKVCCEKCNKQFSLNTKYLDFDLHLQALLDTYK